ncbi:hypothetical protein AAK894_12770 [Lachnospiraceae bacterium 46-61]
MKKYLLTWILIFDMLSVVIIFNHHLKLLNFSVDWINTLIYIWSYILLTFTFGGSILYVIQNKDQKNKKAFAIFLVHALVTAILFLAMILF